MGQAAEGGTQQALGGAAAQGRPARRRPHQGLQQLAAPPLQEAELEELPEHLPAVSHPALIKHSVSGTCCSIPLCTCVEFVDA